MSKTFDELKQCAEEIRTNVLPDSNTAGLVGKQLKDMVDKQEEMAGDINNKLNKDVIVQEQGDDPTKVMSQKAIIEALNDKLNKDAVSQELGDSTTAVMSQKATRDAINAVRTEINVSVEAPTSGKKADGSDGGDLYDLSLAVSVIPELLSIYDTIDFGIGKILGFYDKNNFSKYVRYEFLGGSISELSNWEKIIKTIDEQTIEQGYTGFENVPEHGRYLSLSTLVDKYSILQKVSIDIVNVTASSSIKIAICELLSCGLLDSGRYGISYKIKKIITFSDLSSGLNNLSINNASMPEDHFISVECVNCLPYYGYKDTGTFEFAGYDNSLLEGSTVETSAGPAFKNYKLSIKTTVAQGGDVRLIALEEVIAENSSNVANALSEASDALINSGTALDKANNVSEILDAVNTDDDLRSYGYSELTATADSYSYKKYISASDSAADKEGILKSITARFATAGTCKMCIARYDETHGYLDIDSTHTFTVAAGLQTIDLQAANIKVKADYQPFIMNSAGSVLMVGVKTDTKPNGYKPAIFSTDANEDVIQKGSSVYVEFKWSIFTKGLGLVDRFDEIKENDEKVNNILTNLESKVTELEIKPTYAKDSAGNLYELNINNGVVTPIAITPKNMLIIGHSYSCIISSNNSEVWERGMTSSKVSTDWVHQFYSVIDDKFTDSSLDRIKFVNWETNLSSASDYLSQLDSKLTTSLNAIFIMLGANISTANAGIVKAKFEELIQYCKDRAINAKIYLCSPGYTSESAQMNIDIKDAAAAKGAAYISTYSSDSERMATYGDVVYNAITDTMTFVVNSSGRVNHPSDIWHLIMANRVLSYFGFSELDKFRSITTTSNQDYHCYSRWVAGGECTVKTYGSIAPTIVVKDASGNTINGTLVDLANQTWDTTPSKVPTYAYHFEMPDSNVTITVQ